MREDKNAKTIYVLLVGINDYRGKRDLNGCLNDINLVEQTFRSLYPEEHGFKLDFLRLPDDLAT